MDQGTTTAGKDTKVPVWKGMQKASYVQQPGLCCRCRTGIAHVSVSGVREVLAPRAIGGASRGGGTYAIRNLGTCHGNVVCTRPAPLCPAQTTPGTANRRRPAAPAYRNRPAETSVRRC